jgi:glycosyltransferase involved in cell wall biosynthesis
MNFASLISNNSTLIHNLAGRNCLTLGGAPLNSMISIIIPCYNSELFIHRALNSVLKQTWKDWELILVNNNSTDKTLSLLEDFKKEHSAHRIHVFTETKKGAPAARNRGIREATGIWVQFLDADDEILPEKLAGQLALAAEQKASIVVSPYQKQGIREKNYFSYTRALYNTDAWSALIFSQMGITSSNLFKRDALLAVNGWNETLVASQEYDLMFRILQSGAVVAFDNRVLTKVHVGAWESVSRSKSGDKARKILESRINLRLRIKDYLESKGMITDERLYLINKFIYETLIRNYRFYPDDVLDLLSKIELKLKPMDRLRGFYFMRKMDLKRFLVKSHLIKIN